MTNLISIDIGGTTFSYIIFKNQCIFYQSDTFDIKKFKTIINLLINLKKLIEKNLKLIDIDIICIACPGPLNSKTGEIYNTPNLKILQNINLKNYVKKVFNCENINIMNDANVFALGCKYKLKNEINDVILGITLGTGIGFGIIINNKLFEGSYGMAGEYELSPLEKKQTWADFVGYKFFELESKKNFNNVLTAKEIFNLASNDSKKALNIWKKYGNNLALCLSHVINLLNPNYIIIGGGISKANHFFNSSFIDGLNSNCFIFNNEIIKIKYDINNMNIHYGNLSLGDKKMSLTNK